MIRPTSPLSNRASLDNLRMHRPVTTGEAQNWLAKETFKDLDRYQVPEGQFSTLPRWLQAKVDGPGSDEASFTVHKMSIGRERVYGVAWDEGNVVGITLYDQNGRELAMGQAWGQHYSTMPIRVSR